MSLFYDIRIEKKQDQELLLKSLPVADTIGERSTDKARVVWDAPDYPVVIWDMPQGVRSRQIQQDLLGHPVFFDIHLDVRSKMIEGHQDFVVRLLCAGGKGLVGCVSLVSYGENLLFRKTPSSLEIYDTCSFWVGKRLEDIQAAFENEITVHRERKLL